MPDGIVDNPGAHRFELRIGDSIAAAYYRDEGDVLVLLHTEVPSEHQGQGIGSRLARGVFEELRRTGRKAIAKCPFMSLFAARHPEFSDLVAG